MNKTDNRLICSDEKRAAIKATRLATASKRKNQICKVFECKIVEKRLNNKQHEAKFTVMIHTLFCKIKNKMCENT